MANTERTLREHPENTQSTTLRAHSLLREHSENIQTTLTSENSQQTLSWLVEPIYVCRTPFPLCSGSNMEYGQYVGLEKTSIPKWPECPHHFLYVYTTSFYKGNFLWKGKMYNISSSWIKGEGCVCTHVNGFSITKYFPTVVVPLFSFISHNDNYQLFVWELLTLLTQQVDKSKNSNGCSIMARYLFQETWESTKDLKR